jgi:hypothetical protein
VNLVLDRYFFWGHESLFLCVCLCFVICVCAVVFCERELLVQKKLREFSGREGVMYCRKCTVEKALFTKRPVNVILYNVLPCCIWWKVDGISYLLNLYMVSFMDQHGSLMLTSSCKLLAI